MAKMESLRNKQFCQHNYQYGFTTMENSQLAAALPDNLLCLEMCETYDRLSKKVFKEPVEFKNGYIKLSDKPGFTLKSVENLKERFPYLPGSYHKKNLN